MASPPPSARAQDHDGRAGHLQTEAEVQALAETAHILRQVADYDGGVDARRGVVTASLASLVAAVGRGYPDVPAEVAACAMAVVRAVDHATGRRRA
jgi:hypothetical protein